VALFSVQGAHSSLILCLYIYNFLSNCICFASQSSQLLYRCGWIKLSRSLSDRFYWLTLNCAVWLGLLCTVLMTLKLIMCFVALFITCYPHMLRLLYLSCIAYWLHVGLGVLEYHCSVFDFTIRWLEGDETQSHAVS